MKFVLLAAAICGLSAQEIPLTEFAARRAALRELTQDGVVVLWGRTEQEAEEDRNGFFQESSFYYLSSLRDPGNALLLSPAQANREMLFLARRNPKSELWTGPKLALEDDVRAKTGFAKADDVQNFEAVIRALAPKRIYTLPHTRDRAAALVPGAEVIDCSKLIARLRMKKSAAELAVMQKAIDASMAAHRVSWLATSPGKFEYQVASAMTNTYSAMGCERSAYPPIVGSGFNATILHYFRNARRMDAGELLLMDVGAECSAYAGDITRTVPVNGKFSKRQREIYDAVLRARDAVIAAAKPGVTVKELKQVAIDSLNTHKPPLGQYLPHGVSHHIGLDVHDLADNDRPLEPGAVITVEPGVYIPEESLGVRIEDMLLITEKGARNLTSALPAKAEDIEREMARRN